jgi:hypothetical protein
MDSDSKAHLKNARSALDGQRYMEALRSADAVIQRYPDNYHAIIFKALALQNVRVVS